MGINFEPEAPSGHASWSYGGFHAFRTRLASAIGIDLEKMAGFCDGGRPWSDVNDPIAPFLNHSDCDGELAPDVCTTVAPRLRELVAAWPDYDYDRTHGERLADAMELAAARGVPLEFR